MRHAGGQVSQQLHSPHNHVSNDVLNAMFEAGPDRRLGGLRSVLE